MEELEWKRNKRNYNWRSSTNHTISTYWYHTTAAWLQETSRTARVKLQCSKRMPTVEDEGFIEELVAILEILSRILLGIQALIIPWTIDSQRARTAASAAATRIATSVNIWWNTRPPQQETNASLGQFLYQASIWAAYRSWKSQVLKIEASSSRVLLHRHTEKRGRISSPNV